MLLLRGKYKNKLFLKLIGPGSTYIRLSRKRRNREYRLLALGKYIFEKITLKIYIYIFGKISLENVLSKIHTRKMFFFFISKGNCPITENVYSGKYHLPTFNKHPWLFACLPVETDSRPAKVNYCQ